MTKVWQKAIINLWIIALIFQLGAQSISATGISNKISVDTSSMTYEALEKVYVVEDKLDTLKGEVYMTKGLKALSYDITWGNILIKEGELKPNAEWEIPQLPLMVGQNKLSIKAEDNEGGTHQVSITLFNLNKENEKDVILDKEDTDGDKLLDYEEEHLGTNPNKSDTDGDRLTDDAEIKITLTDPLKKDTDNNHIEDDQEDFDQDGIINLIEVELESNPYNVDSDFDRLDDNEEMMWRTDPNHQDTDGDALIDGLEVKWKFDPKNQDTSGNGILDGDELVKITRSIDVVLEEVKSIPTVQMELPGKYVETLHIRKLRDEDEDLPNNMPGYIGPGYEVSVEGEPQNLAITFAFDPNLLEDETFKPTIYRYKQDEMLLNAMPDQVIDWEKHTITAPCIGGSKYIVLNQKSYEQVWQQVDQQREKQAQEVSKILLDTDGDGLTDFEERGMLLGNGNRIKTDADNSDTDGDGISDGVEIERMDGGAYYIQKTDPNKKDTDGDGYRDLEDEQSNYWDVSHRDLAIYARLAYTSQSIEELRQANVDEDYFLSFASIEEVKKWEKIYTYERSDSEDFRKSFAANAYKLDDQIVVAYRGTDNLQGWLENLLIYPIPFIPHPQAKDAKHVLEAVARQYPHCKLYVTGHSLGGYLALYAAGHFEQFDDENQLVACANFNGLGMDYTTAASIKKSLKHLERTDKTSSYKVKADVVSLMGTHYAEMVKENLAQEVEEKYAVPPKKQWNWARARHDMASFYKYLEPLGRPLS